MHANGTYELILDIRLAPRIVVGGKTETDPITRRSTPVDVTAIPDLGSVLASMEEVYSAAKMWTGTLLETIGSSKSGIFELKVDLPTDETETEESAFLSLDTSNFILVAAGSLILQIVL